jgi:hypothetical protein
VSHANQHSRAHNQLDLDECPLGSGDCNASRGSTCAFAEIVRLCRIYITGVFPWPLQFCLEPSANHWLVRELCMGYAHRRCGLCRGLFPLGQIHGRQGAYSNCGSTTVITTRIPFTMAGMDELWRLSLLHSQLVSIDHHGVLRPTDDSIRHVRGDNNALQVIAQLTPIAPTGEATSVNVAKRGRGHSSVASTTNYHPISRRPYLSCLNGCLLCWDPAGRIHSGGGIVLGFDIHQLGCRNFRPG